ncbi:hypothetical protein L2E82_06834 [Cichorium intybus]|uniref:Uncharacterized protein n=1 Tax=Cichorium intybus TaxID=13427 RepID=A0ACB9HCE0_CICIN|nr:hypothetical protein L2E82_06834 [Cichorium intybus]
MQRSVPNGKLMRRVGCIIIFNFKFYFSQTWFRKEDFYHEDPGWYSRAANFISEPVVDVEMNNPKTDLPSKNEVTLHETKTIPIENGNSMETHDKYIMVEGLGLVGVYDQWVDPPRFLHAAAVIDEKMYIFGGNHNGRYLNDLQTLDLRNWTWSKVEVKPNSESPVTVTPFAGHSLTIESSPSEFAGIPSARSLIATVNFVDLAGSERASQTLSDVTRLKEGCHINRSLLTVGALNRNFRVRFSILDPSITLPEQSSPTILFSIPISVSRSHSESIESTTSINFDK